MEEKRNTIWKNVAEWFAGVSLVVVFVTALFWTFSVAAKADSGYTQSITNKDKITELDKSGAACMQEVEALKSYMKDNREALKEFTEAVNGLKTTTAVLSERVKIMNEEKSNKGD